MMSAPVFNCSLCPWTEPGVHQLIAHYHIVHPETRGKSIAIKGSVTVPAANSIYTAEVFSQ